MIRDQRVKTLWKVGFEKKTGPAKRFLLFDGFFVFMVNIVLVRIVKAALLYFAILFGAGFVLGPIRILWVVPRLGTRMAELMEAPIMLLVTILAARWIVRRLALPPAPSVRLGMGCIAVAFMLVAEFGLVLWLRGLSISEYLASRDPVSGTIYYVLLGMFAIMPLLVARR